MPTQQEKMERGKRKRKNNYRVLIDLIRIILFYLVKRLIVFFFNVKKMLVFSHRIFICNKCRFICETTLNSKKET